MKKKTYAKPFFVVEKFTPNEFVASCDIWKGTFNSSSASATLYYDSKSPYGYYNNGETIGSYNVKKSIEFKLGDNTTYMEKKDDGSPKLINHVGKDTYKFYTSYNHSDKYGNEKKYVYSIIDISGTQYWYDSTNFSYTKLSS